MKKLMLSSYIESPFWFPHQAKKNTISDQMGKVMNWASALFDFSLLK